MGFGSVGFTLAVFLFSNSSFMMDVFNWLPILKVILDWDLFFWLSTYLHNSRGVFKLVILIILSWGIVVAL